MAKDSLQTADPAPMPLPAKHTLSSEVKAVEKAVESKLEKLHAAVDAWFVHTFHNRGLLADEFNRLQAAKKSLKETLQRLV
jgi:hypothetical protein